MDIQKWAKAYVRLQENHGYVDERHPDHYAAFEFQVPYKLEKAEECWLGIKEVVKLKPSDKVLGMLAAGLIEDLLYCHGERFIDRIETFAKENQIFREALQYAWESGNEEVWQRVVKARGNA